MMLLQVDPADVSQQVAKIQEAAQSYTKADGEIVRLMLQKPALLLPKKVYMISALIKVVTKLKLLQAVLLMHETDLRNASCTLLTGRRVLLL